MSMIIFQFFVIVSAFFAVHVETQKSRCRSGWLFVADQCLLVGPSLVTYEDAKSYCKQIQPLGRLLTIKSQAEQDIALQVLLNSHKKAAWLGFHTSRYNSEFSWEDGSSSPYRRWAKKEPNVENTWLHRKVFAAQLRAPSGYWYSVEQKEKIVPFCTSPSRSEGTSHCAGEHAKFTKFGSSCYLKIDEPKTWQEANEYCRYLNSELVSIEDSEENIEITLDSDESVPSIWIGLRSVNGEPFLEWTDSSPVFYKNWGTREPFKIVKPRCGAIFTRTGKWFVTQCDEEKPFVCEHKPDGVTRIGPTKTGKCPDGDWRYFGGPHCYYYGYKYKTSWNSARQQCISNNSNLLSIHGTVENDFLSGPLKYFGEAWTGGFETFHSGLQWSDWTVFSFRNNLRSSDQKISGNQCIALNSTGGWIFRDCNVKLSYYICQKLRV